jgi:predicted secreted protein
MRKIKPITAIALFLGLVILGCTNNKADIPAFTDASQPIMVQAGQEFVIYLPYNPNTGFAWQAKYDEAALELKKNICVLRQGSQSHFFTSQYDIAGSNTPPAQYLQFKAFALSKGETKVTIDYKNPPTAMPLDTQTFIITIK